jgi:hypothetical protein
MVCGDWFGKIHNAFGDISNKGVFILYRFARSDIKLDKPRTKQGSIQ